MKTNIEIVREVAKRHNLSDEHLINELLDTIVLLYKDQQRNNWGIMEIAEQHVDLILKRIYSDDGN